MDKYQELLSSPALAGDVAVSVRIVLRRSEMSAREVDMACRRGIVSSAGRITCELTANGSVVATGSIIEKEGTNYFEGENS